MLNKVILIGEIISDPELKYFKNNSIITIISLITKEEIKGKIYNNWHRVIINEKNKILKKNMIIYVIGKIKTRRWTNNNGFFNYITEIIAEEIKIINNNNYWSIKNKELEQEGKYEGNNDGGFSETEDNVEDFIENTKEENVENINDEQDNENINEKFESFNKKEKKNIFKKNENEEDDYYYEEED